MFASSFEQSEVWKPFLRQEIFRESFAWIFRESAGAAPGKYELGKPGWFVGVDEYSTKPEAECQWENHLRTVDLQYMIQGVEGIEVQPVAMLGEPVLYKEASDTQKFAASSEPASLVVLRPGNFVIFMPGEAHRPKIAVGQPTPLRKLVVKIPIELLV